jgi:hypothetical protein
LRAQDTTQAYPWRLSYFPYITAEPDNGVMAMGRVTWFQQSRWDARTSVDRQVTVEGGYSTRDSWLLRVQADLPHLTPGWRFQVVGEAEHRNFAELAAFGFGPEVPADAWSRQSAEGEVTRTIAGPVALAVRAGWVRASEFSGSEVSETDIDTRGRVALVVDLRDREYDTRSGALLQAGYIVGSIEGTYHGSYALASGWLPLGSATRLSARAGYRWLSAGTGAEIVGHGGASPDAWRTIPGWEDEFVVGGFQSDRAVPPGYLADRRVYLASAEARHDLVTFPGGALTLLAFVDAGRSGTDYVYFLEDPHANATPLTQGPLQDWVVGGGGGLALRLLRSAQLTATLGRAAGATQFYLQSGWSW